MRLHVMVQTTAMLTAFSSLAVVRCAQQPSSSHSSQTATKIQVVHVVASDWKWTLDKTTFSAGQPIDFDITSQEGVHGFSIDGTSISEAVAPGQNVQVDWTPPKPGTYTIRCDILCGEGMIKCTRRLR